jgi:hypothetical protein
MKRWSTVRTTAKRFIGLRLLRLQADLEGSGLRQRHEMTADAVGQATLFAHFLHQARNESHRLPSV